VRAAAADDDGETARVPAALDLCPGTASGNDRARILRMRPMSRPMGSDSPIQEAMAMSSVSGVATSLYPDRVMLILRCFPRVGLMVLPFLP
jgi:hypothetical protein